MSVSAIHTYVDLHSPQYSLECGNASKIEIGIQKLNIAFWYMCAAHGICVALIMSERFLFGHGKRSDLEVQHDGEEADSSKKDSNKFKGRDMIQSPKFVPTQQHTMVNNATEQL